MQVLLNKFHRKTCSIIKKNSHCANMRQCLNSSRFNEKKMSFDMDFVYSDELMNHSQPFVCIKERKKIRKKNRLENGVLKRNKGEE